MTNLREKVDKILTELINLEYSYYPGDYREEDDYKEIISSLVSLLKSEVVPPKMEVKDGMSYPKGFNACVDDTLDRIEEIGK